MKKSNLTHYFNHSKGDRFLESSTPHSVQILRQKLKKAEGTGLVLAIIFMVVATTLITVGMRLISQSSRISHTQQLQTSEADAVARSGLSSALGWFNNQAPATVSAYQQAYYPGQTPVYNSGVSYVDQMPTPPVYNSNPQLSNTISPSIGLVNEYPLDNQDPTKAQIFARFEVPIQQPGTATPYALHDVSGNRGVSLLNGDGLVWDLTSTGYIYQRNSYAVSAASTYTGAYPQWSVPYNQGPNKILAKSMVSGEFRKVGLNFPTLNPATTEGAVFSNSATQVVLSGNYNRLQGAASATGNYAIIAMTSGSCTVNGNNGTNVSPSSSPCTCYTTAQTGLLSANTVFGMNLNNLQNIADINFSATSSVSIEQAWKLTYVTGSVTFSTSSTNPALQGLNGEGIMVVNGNMVMGPQCCTYNGLIFITGNLTVEDNDTINGSVILGTPYFNGSSNPGILTIQGSAGLFGQVIYNPTAIYEAQQLVALYKEDISQRQSFLTVPNW